MDIELNLIDQTIAESLLESQSFNEFCNDLDNLGTILNPDIYLEAVEHQKQGAVKTMSSIYKNTKDTTKSIGTVYKYTTDAGGGIIKSGWDLMMACCKLAVKIIKWLFLHIEKIPQLATKAINLLTDLPSNVVNKIKGNIKLYITAEDLVNLYSIPTKSTVGGVDDISLMSRIDRIIKYLGRLSNGDLWTTYFTNKNDISDFFKKFNDDFISKNNTTDMDIIKRINKEFKYIKKISFNKTLIEMNDPNTVKIYFDKNNKLSYTNVDGTKHDENYISALKTLLDYVNQNKDIMKQFQTDVCDKFIKTNSNEEFARMGKNAQSTIVTLIQTISAVIEFLGNMARYIMADIQTIEKCANQIHANVTMSRNGYKADTPEEQEEIDNDVKKYYKKHPVQKVKDNISDKKNQKEKEKQNAIIEKEKKEREEREARINKRKEENKK